MRKTILTSMTVIVAASALAGCTTTGTGQGQETGRNNTAWGAALGAGVGALGGYLSSGNDDDRRTNALIGAGVGALAGGAVGSYMDRQEHALEQALAGSGVGVDRQGDNILLTMPNSVTFGFDQSNVKPEFYPTLRNVAQVLNQYPSTMIDVVGHTDSVGEDMYNMDLSVQRAQSVSQFLMQQGVMGPRIVVRGMGERMPIASNDTDAGRAQNRRVEILIAPVREGLN